MAGIGFRSLKVSACEKPSNVKLSLSITENDGGPAGFEERKKAKTREKPAAALRQMSTEVCDGEAGLVAGWLAD